MSGIYLESKYWKFIELLEDVLIPSSITESIHGDADSEDGD
jgi:hypothetical protein